MKTYRAFSFSWFQMLSAPAPMPGGASQSSREPRGFRSLRARLAPPSPFTSPANTPAECCVFLNGNSVEIPSK